MASTSCLIICIFVLKNKQPVYLKPKTNASSDPDVTSSSSAQENIVEVSQTADDTSESIDFDKTNANENTDVIRSELKSLRQSAVAMSVSHKDGANQIVQDWMETEGEEGSVSFFIINSGVAELLVSQISTGTEVFSVEPEQATIAVGDSVEISALFMPPLVGVYFDTLSIVYRP